MHEYTNATTTGLVNAQTKEYDSEIIEKLGLPKRLFTKLFQPGTSVGMLKPEIAWAVGGQMEVVLCASHDTAKIVIFCDNKNDSMNLAPAGCDDIPSRKRLSLGTYTVRDCFYNAVKKLQKFLS